MVTLKNIKKGNKIISADCYPEDSTEAGYVVVDLETEEIIFRKDPKEYEGSSFYIRHVINGLLEVAKKDTIPDKWLMMWY